MRKQFRNVVRRGDRAYVRVMIPKDLRGLFGKREFMEALHIAWSTEAHVKGFKRAADILQAFQHARATGSLPEWFRSPKAAPSSAAPTPSAGETPYSAVLFGDLKRAAQGNVPTIMEAFEEYAEDNRRRISADTINQNRYVVRLFSEFLGKDSRVSMINKNAIRSWRTALAEWPVKANEVAELKGYPFPEALLIAREFWGAKGRLCISDKTKNRYLSALGSFCTWLVKSTDYMDANPVSGLYLKLDKYQKVQPFDADQLRDFFDTPLYRGCESERMDHKPGALRLNDHRFWLPLIALYSGARLGEIAQMLTSDVKKVEGLWVFHITREGCSRKRVKTIGSQRMVARRIMSGPWGCHPQPRPVGSKIQVLVLFSSSE